MPDRPDLSKITLAHGRHLTRDDGMCAMEAVAWLAGEAHSDEPRCACPVIAAFVRRVNDTLSNADRQALKAILPDLIGSRSTLEVALRRAFFFAEAVRALPAIRDAKTAMTATEITRQAHATTDAVSWAKIVAEATGPTTITRADAAAAAAAEAAKLAHYIGVPTTRVVEVIREALAIQPR